MADGGILFLLNSIVYQKDDDAEHIIRTIEITDGVTLTANEKWYVRFLVVSLKRIGVWHKIVALYGLVGGTAATHKWNWKDMRILDAAYRLTWGSNAVHSSNGFTNSSTVTPTVKTNTYFNSSKLTNENSVSMGICVKMGISGGDSNLMGFAGGVGSGLKGYFLNGNPGGSTYARVASENNGPNMGLIGGFLATSRSNTNTMLNQYRDRTISSTINISGTATTDDWYLGSINGFGGATTQIINFAYITDGGLTVNELQLMSHIVTFAQGILNRQ